MMEDTRKMLGPQKLMLANILRARFSDSGLRYIKALDGSYIEGFEGAVGMSRKDYVAQGIRDFQKAARQGFIVAYTCGLGRNLQDADEAPRSAGNSSNSNPVKRDAQSRFDYQLAIFLTCAEKYSYFDLKDSYDAKKSKTWLTRRPDYDRPLGPPKGPAVRNGYTYTREFDHASVQLDIENETGTIVWKPQEEAHFGKQDGASKSGLNIGGYADRIQRYGHGFSEPNDFTPEEYDYIAKNYSIFTVEKRHAWGEYGPKPNTEAATIGTAKKLKEINPDIKVLMYWNIVLNWNFYESQTEFNKHPEWVYRDWVFQHANHDPVPMYDLNNPQVQTWWVNAIVDPILRGDLDGVFLDAGPKVPKEQYKSLFKMIDTVRAKIGDDKIVIYNGYRVPNATTLQGGKDFIDHTTGVFVEFFLHSPLDTKEEAAFLFDNLIEAEKAGKMIIPCGKPQSRLPGTKEPFLFNFASFLLFYGPNSYYLYNSGYNKTQGMFKDYPEYDLAPGKPLGSAVRNGWVYTREFERITVTVDIETKEAKIEPHAFTPVNG
ncbi:putative glycoside hydrolase, partial [Planctomycetota bacterium]